MKNVTLKKTCSLLAGCALFFTLNSCEYADVAPEVTPAGSNVSDARKENSMNLNKVYEVNFGSLNNSGVSGMATLTLMGDQLTVTITASGLTPNQTHVQHIHGFMDMMKNAICPPMSADTNGDGIISVAEGVPFYGPILLNLTPFPLADASGMISYQNTFTVSPDLLPLQNRTIVLHGLMVNGVYMPSVPVACGQIMVKNNGK